MAEPTAAERIDRLTGQLADALIEVSALRRRLQLVDEALGPCAVHGRTEAENVSVLRDRLAATIESHDVLLGNYVRLTTFRRREDRT